MKPIQIISQDLFDKVRSRFTNLEMGDENGAVVTDPADARFFDFDFVLEGTNLGRVSISINDAGSLKVYYSQGITENHDAPAKKEWFGFLREMRLFAMRRLLRFDTRDIAKTNLDKNDFQHLAQTQGPKEPEDMTTMNESKKKKQGVTESLQNPAQEQINQILRSQAPNGNYEDDRYLDWIIGPESIQRLVQQTKLPLNQVRNYVTAFCQNPNPEGVAEGLQESRWSPKSSRKTSRAVRGATEVIVRHARPVEETFPGARSQRKNIKAIFIQNRDGERFKYPFIHPSGAFAMAQHVDHGGVPHDPAGKAIIGMSEEIAKLGEFQRTINRATLHDDAMGITERAIGRMNELKATIEALGKRHHYESWAETFQPNPMMDSLPEMDAVTMEQYKEKFTQTNFQEELAGYFPLLHRIMSETNKIDLEDYVSEKRTETKNEKGEVTSWKDEGDWEKSDDKDPKGKVYNLSDKARKETEKLSQKEGTFEAFEEWAESIESGELTPDQIDLLKQAIEDQASTGQKLRLGPNGQTAWDFFSGAVNPDDAEGSAGASFPDDLKDKLEIAAEEFPDMDAMEVFARWAETDYPELLTVLGLGQEAQPEAMPPAPEEVPPAPDAGAVPPPPPVGTMPPAPAPTMENEEQRGIKGAMMSKESMIKEIAKLVKSRYNRDNPDVGPFNGKENIALDVKKSIAEKFGDEAGEQAEGLAMQFMEKLSDKWAEKHGKVEHDGLARLKELIGNLRGKIESVGDVGGHPSKNIMPAEEGGEPYVPGRAPGGIPGNVPGVQQIPPAPEKNPHPVGSDAMKGKVIPDLDKKNSFFGKTYEELDVIRKLSGLAK